MGGRLDVDGGGLSGLRLAKCSAIFCVSVSFGLPGLRTRACPPNCKK